MKFKIKKYPNHIIASVLIIIFFIGSIYQFKNELNQGLSEQAIQYLSDSSKLSYNVIGNKLQDSVAYLKSMATVVSNYESINSVEVRNLLKEQSKLNSYTRMYTSDLNGIATTADGKTYDISNEDFYKKAKSNNTSFSDVDNSIVDSKPSVSFASPIVKNNVQIGIIVIEYNMNNLSNYLHLDDIQGSGNNAIIKKDGSFITDFNGFNDQSNFYELITNKGSAKEDDITKMIENLSDSKHDYISYSINGVKYYSIYQPLGIGDWYLLTTSTTLINEQQASLANKQSNTLTLKAIIGFAFIIFVWIYESKKNAHHVKKIEDEQDTLIDGIPGGVLKLEKKRKFEISFASDGFYELIGYEQADLKKIFSNSYLSLIYEDDRELYNEELKLDKKMHSLEYRIRNADGNIVWVLDHFKVLDDGSIYSVILNINNIKEYQKKLEVSDERYRMILDKTDSIFFEWNIEDDTIIYSDQWENKFGYPPLTTDFRSNMIQGNVVHPNDVSIVIEMIDCIQNGMENMECVTRIRKDDYSYVWCRVYMSPIIDIHGKVLRALGFIVDIDKEKKEIALIKESAELDSLTKLFNRGAFLSKVATYLNNEGKNGEHAFMIIDVDNFKNINDSFGHQYGDHILAKISEGIAYLFKNSDYIGRIGGDEFVVFMKNYGSLKIVEMKAKTICTINDGDNSLNEITCSVGVALYQGNNMSYEKLYKNADKALYESKRNGKSTYTLYDDKLEMIDHIPAISKIESDDSLSNENKELLETTIIECFNDIDNDVNCYHEKLKFIMNLVANIGNLEKMSIILIFDERHFQCCYESKTKTYQVSDVSSADLQYLLKADSYFLSEDNAFTNIAYCKFDFKDVAIGWIGFEKSTSLSWNGQDELLIKYVANIFDTYKK
ncbi:MAG: diguanylate cyclase [Erysipelotrichaceae bacterium]